MDPFDSLAGQFLIAMPGMDDPSFTHGVTLLCQHNEDGAIGLLVNRPAEFHLGDVLEQMQIACELDDINRMPVLQGGPVQTERGFVLHDGARQFDASYRINPHWSVTTSRDILAAIAVGEGPDNIVVTLGYAGWEAGQLDEEIKANAWLTVDADSRIVFDTPVEDRWSAAAGLVGIDVAQLAGYAGHA
ncbi:MAG TPA: YqgE/AlgH family protein [Oleiagrimonas sp.]|nr:YqgE/AlgH family protein [Oleiagrimonas sp.]